MTGNPLEEKEKESEEKDKEKKEKSIYFIILIESLFLHGFRSRLEI